MVEPADRPSTAGQRLGAPESFGVSTLEPGLRPPVQPPGRQVSIRVQMLDDTQEVFQISVSDTRVCECLVLLTCVVGQLQAQFRDFVDECVLVPLIWSC